MATLSLNYGSHFVHQAAQKYGIVLVWKKIDKLL